MQASSPVMSYQLITSETTGDKIQLNFCDDVTTKLQSRRKKVKHVTIVGKARTGKSFLLNAIAGENAVFPVDNGPTVTKGAHISGDIFELHSESESFIRTIDIEGMGDRSQNYDYSLALPVLAASDLILFNFNGQPRCNDVLKELDLLVHIFTRVITNEKNKEIVEEQKTKFLFPPIILVLRNWAFGTRFTPEQYLKEIFASSDSSQEIHRCVKKIDVCFLPVPADQEALEDHEELPLGKMSTRFNDALGRLKQQMVSYLNQPTAILLGSESSTTDSFLQTVKLICDQLNANTNIQIPEVIDATMTYEIHIAVETVIDYVENQCPILPMAKKDLEKFLEDRLNAAIDRFDQATQHMRRAKERTLLLGKIKQLQRNIVLRNREKEHENDELIKNELCKEAKTLLEQFDTNVNGMKDSGMDLLKMEQQVDQLKEIFVAGLVAVARKNNFLGAAAEDTIDEKTARSLLPIDDYLKEFGNRAKSKLQYSELFVERQKATQSEVELQTLEKELIQKNVKADEEKVKVLMMDEDTSIEGQESQREENESAVFRRTLSGELHQAPAQLLHEKVTKCEEKPLATQNREKAAENDGLSKEELCRQVKSLPEQFDAYIDRIRDFAQDILTMTLETDQQRATFASGLAAVASKNNFLGAENIAESALSVDDYLKDEEAAIAQVMDENNMKIGHKLLREGNKRAVPGSTLSDDNHDVSEARKQQLRKKFKMIIDKINQPVNLELFEKADQMVDSMLTLFDNNQ